MSMREEGHFKEFFILHLIMIFNLFMLTLDLYSFFTGKPVWLICPSDSLWMLRLQTEVSADFQMIWSFWSDEGIGWKRSKKALSWTWEQVWFSEILFHTVLGVRKLTFFCLLLGCHTNKELWMAFVDRIV